MSNFPAIHAISKSEHNMSKEAKKDSPPESLRKSSSMGLALVAAAVIAGLGAVYVSFGPGGNGIAPEEVKDQGAGTAPQKSQAGRRKGLAAFSVGHMSTFVAKKKPVLVPSFSFNDSVGASRTLAEWKGKVILLNLWATWCAPCRKEMPDLDRLQASLGGKNFEVVAVSIDKADPKKPKAFLDQIKVRNLNFYHDPTARVGLTLKAYGLPTTLLINREGFELGRLAGPADWGSEDAVNLIKAALADKG